MARKTTKPAAKRAGTKRGAAAPKRAAKLAPVGKAAGAGKAVTAKATSAKPAARKTKTVAPARPEVPPAPRDPRGMMREAAWARMFGRSVAKNPFGG